MNKLSIRKLLICFLLTTLIVMVIKQVRSTTTPEVAGYGFNFYFDVGSPLAFQSENYTITITPAVYQFSGTDGNLTYNTTMGYFDFTANPGTGALVINFPITINMTLDGTSIESDTQYFLDYDFPSHHVIAWGYGFAPPGPVPMEYLDFMFIFGILGLVCMFGGPLYGINKFKKKQYYTGVISALIVFMLGFALFIAWLWSGA